MHERMALEQRPMHPMPHHHRMACMSHSVWRMRQRHKAEGEGSSVPRSRMRHIRKLSEGQSGGESRGAGGAMGAPVCPGNIIDGIAV